MPHAQDLVPRLNRVASLLFQLTATGAADPVNEAVSQIVSMREVLADVQASPCLPADDPLRDRIARILAPAPPSAEEMSDAEKAVAYASCTGSEMPPYVPSRVRLPALVQGDWPFSTLVVAAGDYDCACNRCGAVSVPGPNGQRLGLKPSEFEVLEWTRNAAAG